VGVDVGGTTTTVAVGSAESNVLFVSDQFATEGDRGPAVTVGNITSQINAALETLGVSQNDVAAVGLATPGPATLDGVLLNTPNFNPNLWNNVPIRAELERALGEGSGSPGVYYIGDGQAAAFGEYSIRSGRLSWDRIDASEITQTGLWSLFMVIVGTGLGGGAVRKGRAVRGKLGRAGHVGHTLLPPFAFRYEHDRQLRVGNALCTAESTVSLTGLAHQLGYRLSLPEWESHPLNQAQGSDRDKAKQLRELAAEGDSLAQQLFADQAGALGLTLLNANYLGDYDLIVIGGGVCDLAPDVRESYRRTAEEAYRESALDGFRDFDRFEFSVCGDDAAVVGALAFAMRHDEYAR
jgi:predicted NBD/HSP70 family sugar kinase